MVCTPHQIFTDNQIEKNDLGRACGTCGGQESCMQSFGGEDLLEREHLENLGLDGKIILRQIFKKLYAEAWTGLFWLRTGTDSRSL